MSCAAEWLRANTGCTRVAAIGIGLGGMVAARAVAEGAPIDDLALWAVRARGRDLLRELRAFARFCAAQFRDPNSVVPPPMPDGMMEVAGYLLAPETVAALGELDLTELALPAPATRRVLLLGRDGLPVDERLREHYEASGADVSLQAGAGYAAVMTPPEHSVAPTRVFAETIDWLRGAELAAPAVAPATSARPQSASARELMELVVDGTSIHERFLWLRAPECSSQACSQSPPPASRRRCVPCCSTPAPSVAPAPIATGSKSRAVGPRGASRPSDSISTGIGDSDGDAQAYSAVSGFYEQELVDRTIAALDGLQARGLPGRFVLAGVCSGAYWAARAALTDDRVAGAMMINLYTFEWDESRVRRAVRTPYPIARARRRAPLARAGCGDTAAGVARRPQPSPRDARGADTGAPDQGDVLTDALDRLRARGTESLLLLSRGEPMYDDLIRTGLVDSDDRWPNLAVEVIPSRDHTFRAFWLQQLVHASLDRSLDRVCARCRHRPRPPSRSHADGDAGGNRFGVPGRGERRDCRHGQRYLARVYTDQELLDCGTDPGALAARFAAKEATIKALGDAGRRFRGVRSASGARPVARCRSD